MNSRYPESYNQYEQPNTSRLNFTSPNAIDFQANILAHPPTNQLPTSNTDSFNQSNTQLGHTEKAYYPSKKRNYKNKYYVNKNKDATYYANNTFNNASLSNYDSLQNNYVQQNNPNVLHENYSTIGQYDQRKLHNTYPNNNVASFDTPAEFSSFPAEDIQNSNVSNNHCPSYELLSEDQYAEGAAIPPGNFPDMPVVTNSYEPLINQNQHAENIEPVPASTNYHDDINSIIDRMMNIELPSDLFSRTKSDNQVSQPTSCCMYYQICCGPLYSSMPYVPPDNLSYLRSPVLCCNPSCSFYHANFQNCNINHPLQFSVAPGVFRLEPLENDCNHPGFQRYCRDPLCILNGPILRTSNIWFIPKPDN